MMAKVQEREQQGEACELVVCEDPETGEIIVKPKGGCPRGYIEKIRDKAAASGVTFLLPRIRSREIEEPTP
jgi:hypothetical protein